TRCSVILNATSENLQMRGSREIFRRIETSALVSSGRNEADEARCGAKFTITFTFRAPFGPPRWTGGSSRNNSLSEARIAFALTAISPCLSFGFTSAVTSQLDEQTRSARSRISQSTWYFPSPASKLPERYASPLASSSILGTLYRCEK